MSQQLTIYQKIREATEAIQSRSTTCPRVGVILGSGLGPVADLTTEATILPYSEIPHFHGTSVEGHAGRMVLGNFEGVPCVFLQGRFHRYEGYPMEDVVFPTRVICGLGIETLILTNAAGGVNTDFQPRDIMMITDHINLMGDNPLRGANLQELGPRFPDMTEAYNRKCNSIIADTAKDLKLKLHQGVYAGLLGPTYETPAEIRMLRTLGADAVGMSTVPESIAANHLGVQVVGLSCITNLAAGISDDKLTHQEVMDNAQSGADALKALLKASIPKMIKGTPS